MELGRLALTKAAAACSTLTPWLAAASCSMAATPSDSVGPGSTALTVTPVPRSRLASPREMASWAVLLKP